MDSLTFLDGDTMPVLGLGTWRAEAGQVYDAIRKAINIGYRQIDCASIYLNEKEVGQAIADAIADGDIERSELWVTSKLWNDSHDPDLVELTLKKQLADLQLDYLDLYLVHWPVAFATGVQRPKSSDELVMPDDLPLSATWSGMEQCKKSGLAKHIGVSNCSVRILQELLAECEVRPEMNQVEIHPFNPQSDLVTFCHGHHIHVTAYASLGSKGRPEGMVGAEEPDLLSHPVVQDISMRRGMTPAQVLLCWAMGKGIAVIPKSTREERLRQNLTSSNFTLPAEDMSRIDSIESRVRFISGNFWAFPDSPYTTEYLWG